MGVEIAYAALILLRRFPAHSVELKLDKGIRSQTEVITHQRAGSMRDTIPLHIITGLAGDGGKAPDVDAAGRGDGGSVEHGGEAGEPGVLLPPAEGARHVVAGAEREHDDMAVAEVLLLDDVGDPGEGAVAARGDDAGL